MSQDELPWSMLERLRAIRWNNWDAAFAHRWSRPKLWFEHLRRTACWAEAFDAADAWPFFDIAERVDPSVRAAPDIISELENYLAHNVGMPSIKQTCRAAVHWAALCADSRVELPDLGDPYEPILLMYERGGGYSVCQFFDLGGVEVSLGRMVGRLSSKPVVALDSATLDELDSRVTYYAKIRGGYSRARPSGIVRRRRSNGTEHDEAFTRNLRWEATEYLRRYELGHNDVDHVEITEAEADFFVETGIRELGGQPGL
jgi:hypothetical protein